MSHVLKAKQSETTDNIRFIPPASAAIPVTVEQATYPSLFLEYINLRITIKCLILNA